MTKSISIVNKLSEVIVVVWLPFLRLKVGFTTNKNSQKTVLLEADDLSLPFKSVKGEGGNRFTGPQKFSAKTFTPEGWREQNMSEVVYI